GLARNFTLLPSLQPLVCLIDDELEELVRFLRVLREPVIEVIAHDVLHQPRRIRTRQLLLCLALKFRFANEYGKGAAGGRHYVVGRDQRDLAIVLALAMRAQALGERIAEALLMRAALRGGNGVAIGMDEGLR